MEVNYYLEISGKPSSGISTLTTWDISFSFRYIIRDGNLDTPKISHILLWYPFVVWKF